MNGIPSVGDIIRASLTKAASANETEAERKKEASDKTHEVAKETMLTLADELRKVAEEIGSNDVAEVPGGDEVEVSTADEAAPDQPKEQGPTPVEAPGAVPQNTATNDVVETPGGDAAEVSAADEPVSDPPSKQPNEENPAEVSGDHVHKTAEQLLTVLVANEAIREAIKEAGLEEKVAAFGQAAKAGMGVLGGAAALGGAGMIGAHAANQDEPDIAQAFYELGLNHGQSLLAEQIYGQLPQGGM